jgi:hypothetical protein
MCSNVPVKHIALLLTFAAIALSATAQQARSQPVGEVFASDASVRGAMVMTSGGTRVMSGSQVEAGDSAAVLRLTRGGQVRICPRTNLAIGASATGPELMLGLNTGAIEADYRVGPFSDTVVTPDFRLQLAGPGTFHVSIGSGANGDTCVRTMPGNASSVIVNEMMGNGVYQVRAGDSVTFRGGKLTAAVEGAPDCGCPAPPPAPEIARVETPAPVATASAPAVAQPQPPETHVEVDAPMVFHADRQAQDLVDFATLRTSHDNALALQLAPRGDPPPSPAKKEKKGLLARLSGFFSKVFR